MQITPKPLSLAPQTQDDPQKVDKVSRQLEGQFAQMLVKSMRQASFGDSLFPGENQAFRDMYDQQMAKAMTEGKGLGLSAMIARQLGGGTQGSGTGQVDTSLTPDPTNKSYSLVAAKAARAYSLVSGGRDASVPAASAASAAVTANRDAALRGARDAATAQTLDLIAGRQGNATGGTAIGAASRDDAGSITEDWSTLDDRWLGTGPVAVNGEATLDASAGNAAAAQLGEGTPEGFVAKIWHHAQKAAQELGVDPRALVAQAALETGWGRRGIAGSKGDSHNLFGIKATGWSGERVTTGTHEYVGGVKTVETADFRAYRSAAESFSDYVRLLKNSDRYQQALKAGTDIKGFARGLQQAGYATDPRYAAKIAAIAAGPTIDRAVAAVSQAARLATSQTGTSQFAGSAVDLARTVASNAGLGNLR